MTTAILNGTRVLFLEDEVLVNMSTTMMLEDMGCVVESCLRIDEAHQSVSRGLPDIAVLDINICGEMSYGLAERLDALGVPIVFLTGYDRPATDGRWSRTPLGRKPCNVNELKSLLVEGLMAGKQVPLPDLRRATVRA